MRVDKARIQQLVRGFAADWKRSIESLNQEVMQSFSNFKTGTYILQVSMSSEGDGTSGQKSEGRIVTAFGIRNVRFRMSITLSSLPPPTTHAHRELCPS